MPIIATDEALERTLPPEGVHVARCYKMLHVGIQNTEYQGEAKTRDTVIIFWELPNAQHTFDEAKGPEPFSINKEYTLTMYEKGALRKHLEAWRGKSYTPEEVKQVDITAVIGHPCQIQIAHKLSAKGNKYSQIVSIMAMPAGLTAPNQINDSFEFSVSDFDAEKMAKMANYHQDMVRESVQYKAMQAANGSTPAPTQRCQP